ncbi:MAG: PIG-L family deacetylase [Candidatus Woykebacteria bacterium]
MISLKNKKLLVVAAHPDDETLGCGGLISKIKEVGGKVYVPFLTNGTTQDFSAKGISTSREREKEIESVANFLDYDDYKISLPGNEYHLQLDKIGQKQLIHEIERGQDISLEQIKPDIIAFHSHKDYNQDHEAVAKAAFSACRPAVKTSKFVPETILSFEEPMDFWSLEQNINPNFFVELSQKQLNKKLAALKLYKSQLKERGNPRHLDAIRSLAIYRGSAIGKIFAEGFYCHKMQA